MAKFDLRKQIAKEMKKRAISIPAMARAISCNQQTLYNWFAGKSSLSADYLQKVLAELGGRILF